MTAQGPIAEQLGHRLGLSPGRTRCLLDEMRIDGLVVQGDYGVWSATAKGHEIGQVLLRIELLEREEAA
jgi:hypothetical protein